MNEFLSKQELIKFFAELEFDDIGGLDFDLFTGLRVSTLARFVADFLKRTETNQVKSSALTICRNL